MAVCCISNISADANLRIVANLKIKSTIREEEVYMKRCNVTCKQRHLVYAVDKKFSAVVTSVRYFQRDSATSSNCSGHSRASVSGIV
jgi:hypothetical protein